MARNGRGVLVQAVGKLWRWTVVLVSYALNVARAETYETPEGCSASSAPCVWSAAWKTVAKKHRDKKLELSRRSLP